jgi:hypothetical protein
MAYNSQTLTFSSTSQGKTINSTASFLVIYRSTTTIKVNSSFTAAGNSEQTTLWILKNGTVLAVNIAGQNLTGTESSSILEGSFAGFYEEIDIGQQQSLYSTDSQYFHSTGTTSVTIGLNTLKVTNYALNSLPETVNSCGTVNNYTAFTLSIGTPSGTSFPIVTNLQFAGTSTVNGAQNPFNVSEQVTAFSVA